MQDRHRRQTQQHAQIHRIAAERIHAARDHMLGVLRVKWVHRGVDAHKFIHARHRNNHAL